LLLENHPIANERWKPEFLRLDRESGQGKAKGKEQGSHFHGIVPFEIGWNRKNSTEEWKGTRLSPAQRVASQSTVGFRIPWTIA
jgi:hypothetical protein